MVWGEARVGQEGEGVGGMATGSLPTRPGLTDG